MPSRPTLFDDSDPYDAGNDDLDAHGEPPAGDRERTATERHPNYLFRRAVVVGGVVAVIATAAIVIGNLIGTGGTSSVSGAIAADWNRVVQIDERLGRVIIQNDQGEELDRIDTEIRSAVATSVVGPTTVLVDADSVATVDLASATVTDFDFGADRIATPSGSALTVVAADTPGQRGLLVHAPSGERVDTTEFAPIPGTRYDFDTARATPSGRAVLVTDSGNFQSVLFSFDRDEPSFFPGLALAVGDDAVVTAQNVGTAATVNVFRYDEEQVSSGRTDSVRAAIIAGGAAQLVTVDGQIVEMGLASGDTSDGDRLDIGTVEAGHVWTSGDRLVVTGTEGTAIVTADGEILATIAAAAPVDATTLTRARCLIVAAADGSGESPLTMIDVADGTVVAESDRSGTVLSSADGCTALIDTVDGYQLLDTSGAIVVDTPSDIVALAPDAAAIVEARDGRSLLIPIDRSDETEDSTGTAAGGADDVDLGPDGRALAFTEL